jgi:predicted nuclease of predicted toxin-antitoxin system
MRFLLDENTDERLADYLRSLGHDVKTIAVDYTRSVGDPEVLRVARAEQRILITNDRDFGELIAREHLPHAGVIYFRLSTTRLSMKIERLDYILANYPHQLNQLLVVREASVRVYSK